jgi:hypothetical protein
MRDAKSKTLEFPPPESEIFSKGDAQSCQLSFSVRPIAVIDIKSHAWAYTENKERHITIFVPAT